MKKLLLLLLTLLAFAPPGAKAQEFTTKKIISVEEDAEPINSYTKYSYADANDFSLSGVEGPIVIDGGKLSNLTSVIYLIKDVITDNVTISFDYTDNYNRTSSTPAKFPVWYAGSLSNSGAANIYPGTKLKVSLSQELKEKGAYIKSITFYSFFNTNGTFTEARFKAQQNNLTELNKDIVKGSYISSDQSSPLGTWTAANNEKIQEKEFATSNTKLYYDSGTEVTSAALSQSIASKLAYQTKGIVVTYEISNALPTPSLLFNGSLLQDKGEANFENSTEMYFTNGGNSELDGSTIYYTIVPAGETLTEFPVGEEAEAAGIKSTPIGSLNKVTVSEGGTLYYWAYNPTDKSASEPASATLTRKNRLTIYSRDGIIDGTLDVYYDNNGTLVKEAFKPDTQYNNVKRLVFIPNAPNNTDAIIITMNGQVNINPTWAYIYANSRFTITTQNGGLINKELFDCTAAAGILGTRPNIGYINYDDYYENLSSYWSINTQYRKEYNNPKTTHTFYASQGIGFDKLSIIWEPSDNVKAPSAPRMTLAEGGQGAFEGGIFRMIDQLDLTVTSDGPAYYFLATDNTTTDVGFAFGNASYLRNSGERITITRQMLENSYVKNARVLLQAGVYTDKTTKSNTAQAFIELIDAQRFDNLADIIKPENTGKEFVVTNNSELTINGVYQTRVDEGSAIATWYAYVTDIKGNAIKIVSQGTALPASYKAGTKIGASGLVGTFRYNYGSPEIVIGDAHRSFLKDATVIADYSFTAPDVEKLTTTPTAEKPVTDFNRKVRLRNVRWLAANNEVEDKDGAKYLIYSRLVACDDPSEFTSPMFNSEAGTHWCIEGYVGQVNGKTAIFPTAKVLPCPTKPVLLAPNPVEGDIEAISKTVTVTVAPEEGISYFYCINEEPTDMEALTAVPEEGIELGDEHFRDVCELYVYAKSADGLWSTEPAILRITRHSAIEVASIADFKKVFIDETTGAEKKDLFEGGSLKADAIDETAGIATHYQLTGDAIVVKRTPNYLYLRDYKGGVSAGQGGLNSMNYLLVYNANHWEQPKVKDEAAEGGERELRAGDVISGIALVPELTSLGNLRSNTTSFARTVAVNYDIASDSTKVQPLTVAVGYDDASSDHYFSNVTVDDTYRMRYYTFEGVKVKYDDATDTYTLDIATPVRMSFDIFSTRGGWVPAYAEGASYNITGIVLRDGEEGHFAIAPISFKGSGTVAAPSVFLTENENNDALASSDIQEGGHTLKVKMAAEPGAVIYYSVNGKNPLDNADADTRKVYTAGEEITLEFAEGQDRAVVMAFAAEPGKTPSAVVTRTFIKSSRELTYLLNFINQGEQDRLYHFNGNVAVVALGGKWMMVRGAVGHYLPIYNADAEWDADAYKTGGYLTDFVMRYDELEGNIRGIAEAGRLFPEATSAKDPSWEEITFIPDSVTSISERNARRYVKLHSANVQAAAAAVADGDGDADAAKWTVTGTSHQGAPHALVLDMLGTTAGAETLEDGGMYDITGFVMLDADGAAQLWATEVEKIAQTARVSVKINGTELTPVRDADTREYEAEFVRGALVTLEVSDPRPSTVIRYSYDNMNWFTYGEPFLVTESVEQIHAVAQALNERESVHTHIKLTRKEESGDVTITVDAATPGKATVTMTAAEEGTIIYWTSKDNTEKTYSAPVVFEETQIVYARLQVAGKTDGAVSHALVEIASEGGAPSDKVSGNVDMRIVSSEPGKVVIELFATGTPAPGSVIKYTTVAGAVLPDDGETYTEPIVLTESATVMAVLVEPGKVAGALLSRPVWVVPVTTGIDGIEGEGENAVRVDGSDIIAPQGSEVYDLNGRRVNPTGLASGVYIVRTPDGKAIKVRI